MWSCQISFATKAQYQGSNAINITTSHVAEKKIAADAICVQWSNDVQNLEDQPEDRIITYIEIFSILNDRFAYPYLWYVLYQQRWAHYSYYQMGKVYEHVINAAKEILIWFYQKQTIYSFNITRI